MLLRTVSKDDFFEARLEDKPAPKEKEVVPLGNLMSAIDTVSEEISVCDNEIQKWQSRKTVIRNAFQRILKAIQ